MKLPIIFYTLIYEKNNSVLNSSAFKSVMAHFLHKVTTFKTDALQSIFFLLFLFIPTQSLADPNLIKQKVNLEDVNIQGEGSGSKAILQNRNRFELDSRLKLRKEFRTQIENEVPEGLINPPQELYKQPPN